MNEEPARPSLDDPALESLVRARLEEAFARWQGELIGTLFYLVGNLDDARDVLQDAFIKAWRQRHQVAEVQNLKAWIFRIALNAGRDLRQSAWRRKRQPLPDNEATLSSPEPGAVQTLIDHEELSILRSAIGNLRPEEKEVFLLRQNGELTYDEIGELLGVPVGTVKTRMRLAICKLRAVVALV